MFRDGATRDRQKKQHHESNLERKEKMAVVGFITMRPYVAVNELPRKPLGLEQSYLYD